MSTVYGPKWSFYSCDDILDCLGQVYTGIVFGRVPRTKETLPNFSEVASGNSTSTCVPWVDR